MKILMGCPIFNVQDPQVRQNHQIIKNSSKHDVSYIEVVGASVEHGKQIMYRQFLKTDCDYFFNVDADIFFMEADQINPIDLLVNANKEVVGGIYVYKREPVMPTHRPLDLQKTYEDKGKFPLNYVFKIPNKIHEVEWLSGGCMLIKREVIEKLMFKHQVPNLPMVYKGEYLSEDFAFCKRARDEGYSIWAEPRINLGHQGKFFYTLDLYKPINK